MRFSTLFSHMKWGKRRYAHLRDREPREPADERERLRRRLRRYRLRRHPIRGPNSIPKSLSHQIFGHVRNHQRIRRAVVSHLKLRCKRYCPWMNEDQFLEYCDTLAQDRIDDGCYYDFVQAAADLFRVRIVDIGSYSEYAKYVTLPVRGFKETIFVCSTPGHMDSLVDP